MIILLHSFLDYKIIHFLCLTASEADPAKIFSLKIERPTRPEENVFLKIKRHGQSGNPHEVRELVLVGSQQRLCFDDMNPRCVCASCRSKAAAFGAPATFQGCGSTSFGKLYTQKSWSFSVSTSCFRDFNLQRFLEIALCEVFVGTVQR